MPVNAYFDRPTLRGVRVYQRRVKLAPDGVAGEHTLAALGLQQQIPVEPKAQPKPKRPVATVVRYVVKPGESLSLLAGRFDTTIAVLAKLNGLDPAKPLLIGTKLRVPAKVTATAVPVSATVPVADVRASIDRWAAHFGVDPHLARALAWMESGFNNAMVSSVGAQGVMQLLPSTWDYVETSLIGHKIPHTADGNVHVGMAYLRHLLDAFGTVGMSLLLLLTGLETDLRQPLGELTITPARSGGAPVAVWVPLAVDLKGRRNEGKFTGLQATPPDPRVPPVPHAQPV